MNQQVENINVPNVVQFKTSYKSIVHELVQIRNSIPMTQAEVAEWLKLDRRKIISFESLKKVDLETMLIYADKLSVDINFKFEVK